MIIGNKVAIPDDVEKSPPKQTYKIDEVLQHFGKIGRFQMKLIAIALILGSIAAWRILFDLFSAKSNTNWACTSDGVKLGCSFEEDKMPCEIDANKKLEKDGKIGNGLYWKFNDTSESHSIKSTMKLACNEHWKFSFISSIYFVGAFFGVWMFGRVSDLIGRRKTCLISLALCVAQAWVIPFFNDINVYLTCRFFDGAAFGGFFLIAFVLEVEYAPPKYRNILSSAFHFVTSVGMATIAVWGVLFKPWKSYSIALAFPPTIMLPVCFFFYARVPQVLFEQKERIKKLLQLLEKVAKVNNTAVPENCMLYEDVDTKVGFFTILQNKKLVVCALINMYGWFMTSLVYYMLWFSAKYLAGDIYVNAAVLGVAELPGRVGGYFALQKFGRKYTFMGCIGAACLCMFISIWKDPINVKIMYCLGKALTGALWAAIYLYSSEMYPTRIRNLGSGIGSAAARVAALIAPFIGDWIDVSPIVPYVLVGVLAIICSGTFYFCARNHRQTSSTNFRRILTASSTNQIRSLRIMSYNS